jgi:hypothetical protein
MNWKRMASEAVILMIAEKPAFAGFFDVAKDAG